MSATEQVNRLTEEIDANTVKYRAGYETETRSELNRLNRANRELQLKRSALIADGCSPCPICNVPAHGMLQTYCVDKVPVDGFGVGCPKVADHCAVGDTVEEARANWEKGPRVPKQRDENGAVIALAKGGWRLPNPGALKAR